MHIKVLLLTPALAQLQHIRAASLIKQSREHLQLGKFTAVQIVAYTITIPKFTIQA